MGLSAPCTHKVITSRAYDGIVPAAYLAMVFGSAPEAIAVEPRVAARVRRVSQVAALTTSAIGALALLGCVLDMPLFQTFVPGLPTMVANTAIGMIVAGVCAYALHRTRGRRAASDLLALVVIANGCAVLVEYAFGIDIGIDRLIVAHQVSVHLAFPGRMSIATAVTFVTFGLALLASGRRKTTYADGLAIAGGTMAWLRLLGYAYGGTAWIGGDAAATMALPTTVAFCLLMTAILGAHPELGALRLLVAPGVGGRNVRRLVPTILLFPSVVAFVLGWGEHAGLYDPAYHLALVVTLSTLLLLAVIWRGARAEEIGDRHREAFEEMLKRSEIRYRLLTEQSTDIIARLRRDGTFSYVSPSVQAITGYDPDKLVGRHAIEYIAPDDVEEVRCRLEHARQTRDPETICARVRRRDGGEIWLETTVQSVSAFGDADDQELACVSRDVTERKEIEQLRTDFLAMLSHDLKNPLGVVLGYVEMLADRPDEATLRDAITRIRASAAAALRTTTNFIASTRIDSGALQLHMEPRTIDGLVRDLVQQHDSAARLGSVTLRMHLGHTPPLMLDQHLFAYVLDNLLSNAVKFSPPRGEVEIGTYVDGDEVELYVRDRGPGVPPDERPRLFQRFGSGRNALRYSTGLGLFIARSIVEAHGGAIAYEAPREGGSVFRVRLHRATGRTQDLRSQSIMRPTGEHLH